MTVAETEAGVVRQAGAEAETHIADRGRRRGRGMGGDSDSGRRGGRRAEAEAAEAA